MKPCSFWSDGTRAANQWHCSAHGERHPAECAEELRKELDAALLQNSVMTSVLRELKKMYILNAWTRQDINERLNSLITDVLCASADTEKRVEGP